MTTQGNNGAGDGLVSLSAQLVDRLMARRAAGLPPEVSKAVRLHCADALAIAAAAVA